MFYNFNILKKIFNLYLHKHKFWDFSSRCTIIYLIFESSVKKNKKKFEKTYEIILALITIKYVILNNLLVTSYTKRWRHILKMCWHHWHLHLKVLRIERFVGLFLSWRKSYRTLYMILYIIIFILFLVISCCNEALHVTTINPLVKTITFNSRIFILYHWEIIIKYAKAHLNL